MDTQNNENESQDKDERSKPEVARDEIKKFKENLLQSVSSSVGESIISDGPTDSLFPKHSRSRSASRVRETLVIPENFLKELDESKLFELKEAFLLFDLDGDGCIDYNDLRGTLVSLGEKVDEQAVRNMLSEYKFESIRNILNDLEFFTLAVETLGSWLSDTKKKLEIAIQRDIAISVLSVMPQVCFCHQAIKAPDPMDFDTFVTLLGYKTLELDSEETLVEALSRWDKDNSGYILEERFRRDLITRGDRFTEKEADYALEEAPIITKGGKTYIDYIKFCKSLCGLKKSKKPAA